MDTQKFRQKILDLAIKGKLISQNPNDEPASKLLDSILAEKQKLVKSGKIKTEKRSSFIFKKADNSYYEKVVENGVEEFYHFNTIRNYQVITLSTISRCSNAVRRR